MDISISSLLFLFLFLMTKSGRSMSLDLSVLEFPLDCGIILIWYNNHLSVPGVQVLKEMR